MEQLNLPVIKLGIPLAKSLSMEEYIKFVNLNLQYITDRKAVREQKKFAAVNIPFSL